MAYKPQYCPGQTHVAENRRKQLDPTTSWKRFAM